MKPSKWAKDTTFLKKLINSSIDCLVLLLSGKALEVYSAMDEERVYFQVGSKSSTTSQVYISQETSQQQFRSTPLPLSENPTETYHRLWGLYWRWIHLKQHTKEHIGETINTPCSFDLREGTWANEGGWQMPSRFCSTSMAFAYGVERFCHTQKQSCCMNKAQVLINYKFNLWTKIIHCPQTFFAHSNL